MPEMPEKNIAKNYFKNTTFKSSINYRLFWFISDSRPCMCEYLSIDT